MNDSEDTPVPSPEEAIDSLLEHDKHPKKIHHVIIRTVLVTLVWACACTGFGVVCYHGWLKGKSFWEEHKALQVALAAREEQDKIQANVEKTLSMAYDHLTPWETKYYAYILMDFSKKYNIPWEAYAALIRYESNFNPTLKSDSGAIGMTQVIEPTGKKVAAKIGIRWRDDETLWNDLYNMVIGLTYFSDSYVEALNEGQTRTESLQHAMRHYVSGTGDPAKIKKKSKEAQVYVKEYKTSVWQECKKLMMFYRGVQAGEPDSLILEAMGN